MMIRAASLLLVLSAPLAAQANGPTPPQRSAATHGAYSESQATDGEMVYKKVCASCHELSFHTGEEFRMNWFSQTVWDLFKILKTTMPEDNIGGLTDDEYTRVIAYVFKLNGFPASTDSLKADSLEMKKIRIGPMPDSTKPPTRRR
jgi:mono/diheme cytochrome c family protein